MHKSTKSCLVRVSVTDEQALIISKRKRKKKKHEGNLLYSALMNFCIFVICLVNRSIYPYLIPRLAQCEESSHLPPVQTSTQQQLPNSLHTQTNFVQFSHFQLTPCGALEGFDVRAGTMSLASRCLMHTRVRCVILELAFNRFQLPLQL